MVNQVTANQVPVDIARLAEIESAQIFTTHPPSLRLLEVVAQPSGFNWKLHISVQEILIDPLEYWPYQVVEVKDGPDWPEKGGHGPVVPKTTLYQSVTRVGTKGIAIIGSNKTINLDIQK